MARNCSEGLEVQQCPWQTGPLPSRERKERALEISRSGKGVKGHRGVIHMGADITQDDGKAWGRKNNMHQTPVNDQESRGWDAKPKEWGRGQISRILEGLVGCDEILDFILSTAGRC